MQKVRIVHYRQKSEVEKKGGNGTKNEQDQVLRSPWLKLIKSGGREQRRAPSKNIIKVSVELKFDLKY